MNTPQEKDPRLNRPVAEFLLLTLHGQEFWFSELIYRSHHHEGRPVVWVAVTRVAMANLPLGLR